MPTIDKQTYSVKEWLAEAERRFGPHARDWQFKCPVCGHVAKGSDYVDAGLTPEQAEKVIAFSCIGRYVDSTNKAFGEGGPGDGPCDYTTGGLLNISPITVVDDEGKEHRRFAFADA